MAKEEPDSLLVWAFPEAQKRRNRQSSFDPFAASVLERWQDGERNGLALWREIKVQGYTGTERSVYSHLETLKQAKVRAGFTWPINNGQVEGQVTKLKLIKRQMYGRAGFPLLRQRVLYAL